MSRMLRVENISKTYQLGTRGSSFPTLRDALGGLLRKKTQATDASTLWALRDVSFELEEGDTLGLIGRNGAGKSTLLKILSRITDPTAGTVELYGRVGSLLEVGTGFHPELSGRENIFLNGAILGMSKVEIRKHFDEIVDFAEVEQFIDTPVKRYSSGMYTRLAFAVAAHLNPEILLIDEVLAVGDAQFQQKCLGKMSSISDLGRTIVFVSHNVGAVSKLCKKALLLENGMIIASGPTGEVVSKYMNAAGDDQGGVFDFEEKDSPATFVRITTLCPVRGAASTVDVTQGLEIQFDYSTREAVRGLELSFTLFDKNGSTIFVSSKSEGGLDHILGEHTETVKIPGNFLAPGRYVITAALHQPGTRVLDIRHDCVVFTVEETGSTMQRYSGSNDIGSILVNLEWRNSRKHSDVT